MTVTMKVPSNAQITSLLEGVGWRMGAAIRRREDNTMRGQVWWMEGRPACSCGRRYKRVGWYIRHLERIPHGEVRVARGPDQIGE